LFETFLSHAEEVAVVALVEVFAAGVVGARATHAQEYDYEEH